MSKQASKRVSKQASKRASKTVFGITGSHFSFHKRSRLHQHVKCIGMPTTARQARVKVPCDKEHGPETRRLMFILGRVMFSTQTNDITSDYATLQVMFSISSNSGS